MRRPLQTIIIAAILAVCGAMAVANDYRSGFDAFKSGDFERAREIWRPLADAGDVRAQYGLGVLLERGPGDTEPDLAGAAKWYARAAEQGHPSAENNLALIYAQGRGVERDSAQAARLWRRAAESGHLMAQYNLGLALYRGEGVQRDPKEALRWFRRAAEHGLPDGQFALAQMYRLGVVVEQDREQALAWYQRAADQGHRTAASHAQLLIEEGREPAVVDVPRDGTTSAAMGMKSPPGAAPPKAVRPDPRPSAETQLATVDDGEATSVGGDGEAGARAPAAKRAPAADTAPAPAAGSGAAAEGGAGGEDTTNGTVREPDEPARLSAERSAPTEPAGDGSAAAEKAPEAPEAPGRGEEEPSAGADEPVAGAFAWIGSLRSQAAARRHWQDMTSRFPEALDEAQPRYVRIEIEGKGTFYRVMAGPYADRGTAGEVCAAMKARRESAFCIVISGGG